MYPLAARRALTRRLDVLSRNLPPAMAGDVEAVHRARVASRRLRELLAVLSPEKGCGDRKAWRAVNTRVRAVTRGLGGVRELDVALELLDETRAAHPDLTAAVMSARAVVEDARQLRADQMQDELTPSEADRLGRRLVALLTVPHDGRHKLPRLNLHRRIAEHADRLEGAVASAGALFAQDRLHEVRIAAKKLRYGLELVEELLGIGTKRPVGRLRTIQDLLGRMHDLGVLAEYVRRVGAPGPRAVDVRGLLSMIEWEVHALHAAYLGRVHTLVRVVDECRTGVAARLDARAARSPEPVE